MVVKLTGVIEGNPVIFERKSGDVWECTIPETLNGAFAVELTAIDEAGNVAHVAKYIVTIDMDALYVHIERCMYNAELLLSDYKCVWETNDYYVTLEE